MAEGRVEPSNLWELLRHLDTIAEWLKRFIKVKPSIIEYSERLTELFRHPAWRRIE